MLYGADTSSHFALRIYLHDDLLSYNIVTGASSVNVEYGFADSHNFKVLSLLTFFIETEFQPLVRVSILISSFVLMGFPFVQYPAKGVYF